MQRNFIFKLIPGECLYGQCLLPDRCNYVTIIHNKIRLKRNTYSSYYTHVCLYMYLLFLAWFLVVLYRIF